MGAFWDQARCWFISLSPTCPTTTSGVTGGGGGQGAEWPRDFWPGNFCWHIGKKETRKKRKRGENWEEKKENCKMEGGKFEMEVGKVLRTCFLFCFSLLKTTKICFGCTKMGIFYPEKTFHAGKKIWKWNDFAPSEKIYLLRPCYMDWKRKKKKQINKQTNTKQERNKQKWKHHLNAWLDLTKLTFSKLSQVPPPLPGHLYFRLDIILIKGLSKHTLNTYFSDMKISRGVLITKVYPGTCHWNGSQNQPPGITMTPYSAQKLV